MLLALDVDGVILNFDNFYAKFAYEKFGVTIQDKTAWNMNKRYGLSEKQDKEIWQIINKSNWTKLPIFEDVKKQLKLSTNYNPSPIWMLFLFHLLINNILMDVFMIYSVLDSILTNIN